MAKVSVLVPIYNTNEKFLREAIESILAQTFKDFELLILNDSPDNKELETIVKSYNDDRIFYYENEHNMGISASRNKLLELAKGEYVAIFDHDDISLPERLEKEAKYLDEHKLVGVVSGNIKPMNSKRATHYPTDNINIKINLVNRGLCISHSGAMIRKSVLTENNICYEAEYSPCEDYMLWAKLIDKTMFHNLKEIVLLYRDDVNNTSHTQEDKMDDRDIMVRDYLMKNHPYLASLSTKNAGIYLFGCVPIITVKSYGTKIKYLLFGFIPLIKIVK